MKRHRYLWILVGLLLFASLACNAFAGEPLEPTLPRPDLPGSDSDGDGAGLPAGLPTAVIQNIAPTATLAGEFPATATPIVAEPIDGDPLLRALVDVNIRVGPGVAYARDSFVLKGETAVVLGRHAESGWWKIVCPERSDGNVCWVSGGSEYTSVSNGAAAQAVVAPPTPTAEPTAAATIAAIIAPTAVSDSSAASSALATDLEFGRASAGSRLVYADEGALWLLSLEGETSEPTWLAEAEDVSDVLISPNGRYVAYLTVDEYDAALHLVDIETSATQTLVDAADLATISPSDDLITLIGQLQWLPDNQALAFNTYAVDRDGGPGVGSLEDLWTVDLAGALTKRFPAGKGGGSFAISADEVVLFGQTTAVVRANLDGSNRQTVITFDPVNTASEFAFYPWLQWLADGTATAAISSPEPFTSAEAELWRIPATGKGEPLEMLDGNIIFSPVVWSDSGNLLSYVREVVDEPSSLIVAAGNGQNQNIYADEATRFFAWSPAERYFVYASSGSYAVGQLAEEPLIVDLAEGQTAVSVQWLNDNAFIVVLGSADNWDFRLQTIEGPVTRLVSGANTSLFDSWSPKR